MSAISPTASSTWQFPSSSANVFVTTRTQVPARALSFDAASVEDVGDFFRTHYAPHNAVLAIVGDVEPDVVRGWVERYFGGIPANPALPIDLGDRSLPLTLGGERRETVMDRIPLPRIYFGFRAPAYGDRSR